MKSVIPLVFLFLLPASLPAQQVNRIIYADTTEILVVKIWGTHQERGYALGYLTGDRITDVIQNYVKTEFGVFYSTARNNSMHFCTRCNNNLSHIGDGTLIGLDTN